MIGAKGQGSKGPKGGSNGPNVSPNSGPKAGAYFLGPKHKAQGQVAWYPQGDPGYQGKVLWYQGGYRDQVGYQGSRTDTRARISGTGRISR